MVAPTIPKEQIPRAGKPSSCTPASTSTASLDIKDLIACGETLPNLLSVDTLPPSLSDESLSFTQVPPFPTDRKPGLFTNIFSTPILRSHPLVSAGEHPPTVITVPTGPRLRLMLLEQAYVPNWKMDILDHPAPGHVPWQEGNLEDDLMYCFPTPPWVAEGHCQPSGLFDAQMNSRHPGRAQRFATNLPDLPRPPSPMSAADLLASGTVVEFSPDGHVPKPEDSHSIRILGEDGLPMSDSFQNTPVPTILVSNSTAVIPVSLSSSQSLVRVPLAVRRGKQPPAPLLLHKCNTKKSGAQKDLDPYPGIPTPFLGSPTSSFPSFEGVDDPSTFSMGLEAMCSDLRSRCPDLRPATPPETPKHSQGHWRTVPCSQVSLSHPGDGDEWEFAKNLIDTYGDRLPPPLDSSLCSQPSTLRRMTSTLESPAGDTDSFSWAQSPTLTNSDAQIVATPSTDVLRQQRRKTVIIETPTLATQLLSDRPHSPTTPGHEDHVPIPFESPLSTLFSCAQCHQSTPVLSRPSSTASMRPVKGILKEKKNVRFSITPETYEYEHPSDEEGPESPDRSRPRSLTEPVKRSPRRRSPLRQAFSAEGSPTKEREKEKESPTPTCEPATSLPKHPALRGIIHEAERLQPMPTPTLLVDQQRAPLRSLNAHQSLPAKRASAALYADQASRRRTTTQDVGPPKRLIKTASTPRYGYTAERDENAVRRVSGTNVAARRGSTSDSPQKSKMTVPFRTILTKLRA